MDICFATNNQHKLEEIQALLGTGFNLLSLREIGCHEELREDGSTLEENSLQKARYVYEKYGIPCFADDTGLEVDALGGEPGVFSARYAGEQKNDDENIRLLLQKLHGLPNRKAQFRTVITLITENGVYYFEGIVTGAIIDEKRGSAGFGYDPVFVPEHHGRTFAEMTMDEKSGISHRGIAVKKLIAFLNSLPQHRV
jgi:XTP/dITP diphosphohydrolase